MSKQSTEHDPAKCETCAATDHITTCKNHLMSWMELDAKVHDLEAELTRLRGYKALLEPEFIDILRAVAGTEIVMTPPAQLSLKSVLQHWLARYEALQGGHR